MQKITERKETEFKSVWANGEDVIGPVQSVAVPTGDAPYWTITLKTGDTLWITGQVIVKRGPKDPLKNLSDEELDNRIKKLTSK